MGSGLRSDLRKRLDHDFGQGLCTTARSDSERHRLARALRSGYVISPGPRLYVRAKDWKTLRPNAQHRYLVRSLARLHPDWVFCRASAAIMHGLYVSYALLKYVHVLTSRSSNSTSQGIIQRHKTSRLESELVDDVLVTPVVRTAFDCLRTCDFRSGLAIADSSLRVLGQTSTQLVSSFGTLGRRYRGWSRAVDIAGLGDWRSESGGESVARAVMIEQGYRIPDLQVEVENPLDGCSYRVDFCWSIDEKTRVLGKLDGHEKYTNPDMTNGRNIVDVLADERLRESRVGMRGDRILRFSYGDVRNAQRFRRLLDAYGIPNGYQVPAVANPNDPINLAASRCW